MDLSFDLGWLLSVFLLSLRIGTLFLLTPLFAHVTGSATVRVLFTLSLSAMLASTLKVHSLDGPVDIGRIISSSLAELALGGVLAFGLFSAFGAFSIAGKILDIQSGFSIASVFDPATAKNSPLFASMLNLLAVVTFFAMDAHHALMRGIAYSIHRFPPGQRLASLPMEAVTHQFGLMFSLGLAMIAPVMITLLLVETGFAVISRTLPQMNVFVVSIPVKIVTALAMFAITIGLLNDSMSRAYAAIFTYWEQVLQ